MMLITCLTIACCIAFFAALFLEHKSFDHALPNSKRDKYSKYSLDLYIMFIILIFICVVLIFKELI